MRERKTENSRVRSARLRALAPAATLLTVLALGIGTGCGDDDNGNTNGAPSGGDAGGGAGANGIELTRTRAEALGFALTEIMLDSTAGVIADPDEFARTLETSNAADDADAEDCSPESNPENPADADSDDIPAEVTYTYNCKLAIADDGDDSTEDASLTLTGDIDVRDKDDNNAASGFVYNQPNLTFADNNNQQVTYTVNLDSTVNEENVTLEHRNTLASNAEAAVLRRASYGGNFTLVPESMDSPFRGGVLRLDGALELEDGNDSGTLDLTSSNLTYTATGCDGAGYTDGEITITDESDNRLVVAADNCDYQVSYNGERIGDGVTPAPAARYFLGHR